MGSASCGWPASSAATRASSRARSRRSPSTGFVERDPETLAYRLGWRVFAHRRRASPRTGCSRSRPAILRGLVAELGESAHLSVRQGAQVLTLLSESPASTLHAPGRVGGARRRSRPPRPAACSSSDLGDDELAALGLGEARARRSPARAATGSRSCARSSRPASSRPPCPIRDATGRVIAALNVSAPRFRFEARLDEAAQRLVEVAGELSAELRGELPAGLTCMLPT